MGKPKLSPQMIFQLEMLRRAADWTAERFAAEYGNHYTHPRSKKIAMPKGWLCFGSGRTGKALVERGLVEKQVQRYVRIGALSWYRLTQVGREALVGVDLPEWMNEITVETPEGKLTVGDVDVQYREEGDRAALSVTVSHLKYEVEG